MLYITLYFLKNNEKAEGKMKLIQTVDAECTVLCPDITQIIKGVTKDAVFRKGHVVTKEDIPVLLSVGKDQLYVWEKEEGMLHENEGARLLCELCGSEHMVRSQVKEGKIELSAAMDGLFKVNNDGMRAVNGFGQMMVASFHLFFLNHCMGNIIAQAKSNSSAASRFDKIIHWPCVKSIFPIHKFRVQNHISLLWGMKGL